MIYQHQQQAIDYIIEKFRADPQVLALLITGSIAHGFNDERSDIDVCVIVSDEFYEKQKESNYVIYWEDISRIYQGGYIDGKYITLAYLEQVRVSGNDPTRFALHDAIIAFDRTSRVAGLLNGIGDYGTRDLQMTAIRFVSQLDAWRWYCDEAIKKDNKYLLNLAVSKLILFSGRLILLDNRMFFPYHKWFIRLLESAPVKPEGLMDIIQELLNSKTKINIDRLYSMIKGHRDWADGQDYNWGNYFIMDVETLWIDGKECVDNL